MVPEQLEQTLTRQSHVAVQEQQVGVHWVLIECRNDGIARPGDKAFVADSEYPEADLMAKEVHQSVDVVDVHLAGVGRRADQNICLGPVSITRRLLEALNG